MKTSSNQWSPTECNKYWNKQEKKYGDFFHAPTTQYYLNGEKRLFKEFFGNLKGKKLLKLDLWNEVHNTRILMWAEKQGAITYALDISDQITNKAKNNFYKNGLTSRFATADMRNIPFKKNTFDFIYTMGTIEHIHEQDQAIKEIKRVLKPGGIAIIGVPNKHDIFLRPLMVNVLTTLNIYPYGMEKSFTRKELGKIIEKEGLKIIDESGLLFIPGGIRILDIWLNQKIKPLCKITGTISKIFNKIEQKIKPLRKHGYMIACIAQKN